jgi:hypothetical protein
LPDVGNEVSPPSFNTTTNLAHQQRRSKMATATQDPIEPITLNQHAEEENDFETSDFDSSTLSSSSTSLNTSIYQHAFENGRRVSRPLFWISQ